MSSYALPNQPRPNTLYSGLLSNLRRETVDNTGAVVLFQWELSATLVSLHLQRRLAGICGEERNTYKGVKFKKNMVSDRKGDRERRRRKVCWC